MSLQGTVSVTGSLLGTGAHPPQGYGSWPPSDLLPELRVQEKDAIPGLTPVDRRASEETPCSQLSPFPDWQGGICASAAAGAGTGQLWISAGFLLMELGTVPGPLCRGNALIGMRPEERHPFLCRSIQGWIALNWICAPNPFPETRKTFSPFPPVSGVCSSLVLSSCSVS